MQSLSGEARRALRPRVTGRERATGQALVEFAIVLPVMLVMLLLAVDFGRLFYTYIAVHNAAREAAFAAGSGAADNGYDAASYEANVAAAAAREANVQVQFGDGALAVSQPTCFVPGTNDTIDCHAASWFAGGIGNQVTVTTSQPFSFLTPMVGDLFGGSLTLTADATGVVLNPLDATILAAPTPSASPSVAPDPTPSATPSSTPDPTPTPTPTSSPTPAPMCSVPDFYHTYWNDIGSLHIWRDEAGFTGLLVNLTGGKKIKSQTLVAGSVVPCSSHMIVAK